MWHPRSDVRKHVERRGKPVDSRGRRVVEGREMPEMKNRHVDLRSKKPAEGGRDFGIAGAARCHGECHWKVGG